MCWLLSEATISSLSVTRPAVTPMGGSKAAIRTNTVFYHNIFVVYKYRQNRTITLNKIVQNKSLKGFVVGGALLLGGMSGQAQAEAFTTGVIMREMTPDQRFIYVSGIVEGLAYARFAADGQKMDGMNCIYDWFYQEPTMGKIEQMFTQFNDYTPGPVVAAMLEGEC